MRGSNRAMLGAIVLGLMGSGFGVANDMRHELVLPPEQKTATRREVSKRAAARARAGYPLEISRKGSPGVRTKHTNRTKSRKRRRSVVRMRSHRS